VKTCGGSLCWGWSLKRRAKRTRFRAKNAKLRRYFAKKRRRITETSQKH
jgi:hypothetical protein